MKKIHRNLEILSIDGIEEIHKSSLIILEEMGVLSRIKKYLKPYAIRARKSILKQK